MIGHPINWKEIAVMHGYLSTYSMLMTLRKTKGHTYKEISTILGVSEGALHNKYMDLVSSGKIKLSDLKRHRN